MPEFFQFNEFAKTVGLKELVQKAGRTDQSHQKIASDSYIAASASGTILETQ